MSRFLSGLKMLRPLPITLVLLVASTWLPVQAENTEGGPTYVALEPEFTVNYGQGGRLRYLKAAVTLEVTNNEAALEVNAHSDAIRHEVIMLVSEQSVEEIRSPESRQKMQDELLKRIRTLMERETDQPMVKNVLFTSFVVQG